MASPAELAHVAGLLRKGWLGRQLGALSGDRQTIEQLACRLRLPAIALPSADELQALAQHAGELGTFLANRAHRQSLGEPWAGLDSPFERLHAACQEMRSVLGCVKPILGGAGSLRDLRACDDGALDKIVAHRDALQRLAELPQELGDILSAHAIDEIFNCSRAAEDRLARLAAAVPGTLLLELPHSLQVLDRARRLELRRRHLTAGIQGGGLWSLVPSLAAPGGTQSARAFLDWLDATARAALPQALREALSRSAGEAGEARSQAAACADLSGRIHVQVEELRERFGLTGLPVEDAHKLLGQLASLLDARAQLKDIVELRDQKWRLEAAGIGAVLQLTDDLRVAPGDWCTLLDAVIASRQARHARAADPALRRVSGLRLEAQRKAFVEQDRRKVVHDREALRSRICAVKPPLGTNEGSRKHWTDMRLLNNEFSKERRFVPVRQLAARAGRAMLAMKPCFMMSPLSLAKFLPPGSIAFDVLVIDEASQMKPEDALGGLLRAKQVVVVGDQKQLPPTDFFARSGGGDATASAEDEDFEDSDDESILEACQKAFSNTRMLRWHYRSRCESLIAFSNANFYRNELITFPVARPGSFSVELRQVQGAYEARRNPPEARQIVAEAIAFMHAHADDDEAAMPTLGIVAINTEQRELIREELRLRTSRDQRVERFQEKAKARGEELFVKNLENVQGDKRDTILISLTYGPEPGQTTPHQRFGPVNGKHGHRRLNVLFSRARDRIVLFTSLWADQIAADPASKSQGPQVLKAYLAYAEAGGQPVPDSIGGPADSDFEVEVRERLQRRGYTVDTQVGVSGYRIDLGIRNPDRPAVYLAGIECDGATYHSSKSARDRDGLRQDCLKEKGWEVLRVWSTDWFDDPDGQTDKLASQLEELRQQAAERLRPEEMEQELRRSQHVPPPVPDVYRDPPEAGPPGFAEGDGVAPGYAIGAAADGRHVASPERTRFVPARVADCGIDPNPARFYEGSYRPALKRMVHHVTDAEGPVYQAEW
jgi:very-short-patch-repair endonuclease